MPETDSEESREGKLLHDYKAHPEYDRSVLSQKHQDLLRIADDLEKQVIEKIEGNIL